MESITITANCAIAQCYSAAIILEASQSQSHTTSNSTILQLQEHTVCSCEDSLT